MARNVLILHCHDLGRFVGAYGVTTVHTPHLDALAAQSVVFDAAFSTSPHCSPARASLFTGSYPQQNGVLGLTHQPFGWDLNDPSTHLAHRLHDHGYRTELIGVHHESRDLPDEELAPRLGFDRARVGGDRDVVVERAREALADAAKQGAPFYLQVGFHEPHRTPSDRDRPGVMGFLGDAVQPDVSLGLTVPSHLRDDEGAREELAELQGAVRHMDAGVGEVLAELELLGLADDTVIVFTTDHGLALPRAKCTLYDAGLGVALFVRVPGRPAWTGGRVASQVSHVDLVPTLLELTVGGRPDDVQGDSLVGVVEDGHATREYTFGQLSHHIYYDPKRSVRSADAKLILNLANAPRAMDPTQSWIHRSLPVDLGGPTIGTSAVLEFYDLAADPDELRNVVDEPRHARVVAQHAAALRAWMVHTGDPLLATPTSPRHAVALTELERLARASTEGDRD